MRVVLLLLSMFIFSELAYGQVCTPDTTITEPGVYPAELPAAKVNVAYNETIQFLLPNDTTFGGSTITIDSARVKSVDNIPQGFTYACNKNDCKYKSGEVGCVVISGMTSKAGTYNVIVTVEAKVDFGGVTYWQPFSDTLQLVVDDVANINRKFSSTAKFQVAEPAPHPITNTSRIDFYVPQPDAITFQVYDLLGNQLMSRRLSANTGTNTVTFERGNLRPGIYFYTLVYRGESISRKMVIRN